MPTLRAYQLLWLYFGGPPPIKEGRENAFAIMQAISGYRPPQILVGHENLPHGLSGGAEEVGPRAPPRGR